MPEQLQYSITGADQISDNLEAISEDVRFKSGRFAGRKGAQVIARRAARKWKGVDDPATGRSISENIWAGGAKFPGVRFSKRRFQRTGDIMFRVGVRGTANTRNADGFEAGAPTPHWRLLEFGTEDIRPRGHMRAAAKESAQEAIDEFAIQFSKKLDRLVKRLPKGS